MKYNHQQTKEQPSEEVLSEKHSTQMCPECDSSRLIQSQDGGEILCEDCGLILEESRIDRGPEWRAFTSSEHSQKSRVGAPISHSIHDKGLTTTIGWKNQDATGRSLSPKKKSQMYRLRKWQDRIRTKDSSERNLQLALSEISRMSSAMGIPDSVKEIASILYRRALDEDLLLGRSIEGVATVALYAACRLENIPRSLDEIEQISRVDRIEIARTYRYLADELCLEIEPVDPNQYIPRFCSELNVSDEVRTKAIEIIDETVEKGLLSGRSPTGFAAAAIYAASLLCNDKRTQKEIANVTNVTEVTIRNRYTEQINVIEDAY
ncbi:transcription initiation factor IIB [Natrialbaceae archaeon A-chndr2]